MSVVLEQGGNKHGASALDVRGAWRMTGVLLVAAMAICCVLAGCSAGGESSGGDSQEQAAVQQVGVDEAQEMINSQTLTILDVRTQEEFDEEHLYNATLLTLDSIDETTAAQAIPSKDATVLVYCRTGVRSAEAAQKLADMGYTQVFDMQGGITAWPYDKCVAEHADEGTKEFDDMPVGVKVVCGKTRALPDEESED